jgi:hypothetical protein
MRRENKVSGSTSAYSYQDQKRDFEYQAAVWILEAKAASLLSGPVGKEIYERTKRSAEINREQTRIRTAIEAMSVVPDSTKYVAKLRADLTRLDRAYDEVNPGGAKWREEIQAIQQRHALERAARKRGERVPSLHGDPEAYASWLQRQRGLPWVELARSLEQQSRHSR